MVRITCINAERAHTIEYESLATASKLVFDADADTFYGLAFGAATTIAQRCQQQAGFQPTSITFHVEGTLVAYAYLVEAGSTAYRSIEVQARTKGL